MISTIPGDRVAFLERELQAEMPDAEIELERFPSGAAWLDVRRCGRLFTLNYSPSHRIYEVFEVTQEHVFDSGPCETFDDLDTAAARLREIAVMPSPRA